MAGFKTIEIKLAGRPYSEAIALLSGALMGAVTAGLLVHLISRRRYRRLVPAGRIRSEIHNQSAL